ncbi:C2 family cysteine protease [Streptomyces sp. NPDC058171]
MQPAEDTDPVDLREAGEDDASTSVAPGGPGESGAEPGRAEASSEAAAGRDAAREVPEADAHPDEQGEADPDVLRDPASGVEAGAAEQPDPEADESAPSPAPEAAFPGPAPKDTPLSGAEEASRLADAAGSDEAPVPAEVQGTVTAESVGPEAPVEGADPEALGEPAGAPDPAEAPRVAEAREPDDQDAPESASLRNVLSKARDALIGRHEPADSRLDVYATVDRPAFDAGEIPEYGVRLFQYGTPLDRFDGQRIALFDGPPRREQTQQGDLGDCGLIAALGAVAAHHPEAISQAVRENEDGTYEVRLHQVQKDPNGDWKPFEATGAVTVLTVTPDLVVPYNGTTMPAYAQLAGGVAWPAVLEKALAGVDQTWEEGRIKGASGYQRLDLGTRPYHRAEMLAQLTGRPAYTDDFPEQYDMNGVSPNRQLLGVFREKLEADCPILIASRASGMGKPALPENLVEKHVYEVVAVDDRGMIHLRNPHNFNDPDPMTADSLRAYFTHRFTTLG